MGDSRQQRAFELVERALRLPPNEGDRYLVRECGGDEPLLTLARALLASRGESLTVRMSRFRPLEFDRPPDRIGHYRILGTVGEGGMGVVYLAEQEHPVRRRVALKVIKLGMDTREVIARFEVERQALALMNHPNIAKVFDAGTTDGGRPYFAMEHVSGVPITDHCDRHRLSNRERLDLFQQVCQAVHHAHQRGVIHRDLKPSNILVAFEDGRAVPKVIDFGVAKATSQRLTEKTVYTELGLLIGTPEYMSPEQTEMTGQGVDTTTDVYSLGVILYKLLTGVLPFEPQELRAAGYESMQRMIREVDPPTPSTRISRLGDTAAEVAANRRTDVRALRRQLRGELDWIITRSLEKDRSCRYPSASELGADVLRYLRNEPVQARPHSAGYQFRKLVARHKAPFAFAGVLFLVLAGFGSWMGVLYERAETARKQLAVEAETSARVSDFLAGMFEEADPSRARGDSVTVREVLDRGVEQIETELDAQPVIKARLLHTLGRVYTGLGLYRVAAPLHEEGLHLTEQVFGPDALETGRSLHSLAKTYNKQGRYDEALPLLERAVAVKEAHYGPNHADAGTSINALAATYADKLQFAQAESLYLRALASFEASDAAGGALHSTSVMDLANLYRKLARYDEAGSLYVAALEMQEETLGEDHPDVARTLNNLGTFYYRVGRYPESEEAYLRSLAIREKVLGPEHEETARTLGNLALLYSDTGRLTEAEELEKRAMAVAEKTLGPGHIVMAWAYNDLGKIYYLQGRLNDALDSVRKSAALKEKILGPDNPDFAMSLGNVAAVLQDLGRNAEARPLLERALAIERENLGADHPNTLNMVLTMANLNRDLGDYDRAETGYDRALAGWGRTVGMEHPKVAGVLESRGLLRARRHRVAEADSLFSRALEIRSRAQGEGSPPVATCYYNWGCALAAAGLSGRALDRLKHAVESGFDNEWIAEDDALKALHGNPEFEALLRVVRSRKPTGG
jgi:serine/threonine protein kinase/Tfp pilus assembly protein PilF